VKRFLYFILCVTFFASCSDDRDEIPKDVIAKDKMQKIFWDITLADQFSIQYLSKDTAKAKVRMETMKLYEEVFRIHHITKAEFQKSFQFYQSHPEISKSMFDSLSARANRERLTMFRSNPPKAGLQPFKKPDSVGGKPTIPQPFRRPDMTPPKGNTPQPFKKPPVS
jgi:hypothetical protein